MRGRSHVYKGHYAYVGADSISTCRLGVSPHVWLPYGEVDHTAAGPLPRQGTRPRNQRTRQRMNGEYAASNMPKPGMLDTSVAYRRDKGLSLPATLLLIGLCVVLLGSLLLSKAGRAAAQVKVLESLRSQITSEALLNQQTQQSLAAAKDEAKVCYKAARDLGMVAAEGARTEYISVVNTRGVEAPEEQELQRSTSIFATLFAFLE